MRAREIIDSRYYVGPPLRSLESTTIEHVNLKFYGRKSVEPMWHMNADVYYKGVGKTLNTSGRIDDKSLDVPHRPQRDRSRTLPSFSASSVNFDKFESTLKKNQAIWNFYTRNIKPQFERAVKAYKEQVKEIKAEQFVNRVWDIHPNDADLKPIRLINVPEGKLMDLLNELGIPYMTASRERGVDEPLHNYSIKKSNLGNTVATLASLAREGDELYDITSAMYNHIYAVMGAEKKFEFDHAIRLMARGQVGGLLNIDHEIPEE